MRLDFSLLWAKFTTGPDISDTIAVCLLISIVVFCLMLIFWDGMSRRKRVAVCLTPILFSIAFYVLPRIA
jgi:hypothetical protein